MAKRKQKQGEWKMSERTSFQVNLFERSKRSDFKKWAQENSVSVRLLLYAILKNKKKIQRIISEDLKKEVQG